MSIEIYALYWVGLVSLYTFIMMGWDKKKARAATWRISERHFFIATALGGSIGLLAGMLFWRYKTQKWGFKLPVYGIVSLQLLLLYFYWFV